MTQTKKEKLFGTDGIRGIPGKYPLTDGMVFKIGASLCRYLYYNNSEKNRKLKVIIGKDTRLSGDRIETVLTGAFTSSGIDVSLAGIIPTPGLSFLVDKFKADLGVMISASHNKPQDNGMKVFISGGRKILSYDEEWIEDIVFNNLIQRSDNLGFGKKGEIKNIDDKRLYYREFLKSTLNEADIRGVKVCLDSNWGATSFLAKDIFKDLGAGVCSINNSYQGENINSSDFMNYSRLRDKVLETSSDAGFAFDGDGDRVIAVDERGGILDGDDILAIMAGHFLAKNKLVKNSLAATQMSNLGLKTCLENMGLKVILTPVGYKNVLKALIENNLNLGGESAGHIIFLDYLPVPDGMLTALQLLKVVKETKTPLSELAKVIKKIPQTVVNIPIRERVDFKNMSPVSEKLDYFNSYLKDQGRIFLRYSKTEDVARLKVEAKTKEKAKEIATSLTELISKEIGHKSQVTSHKSQGHKSQVERGGSDGERV